MILSGHDRLAWVLAVLLALFLLVLIIPPASAHGGGTPVASKEGDLTLAPVGNPQDLFHQFGFQMGGGDILHMQYVVTSPQAQAVDFSLHRHNTTGGYLEILNVTQAYLQLDRSVSDSGFYMPQWMNVIAQDVTLHYSMYFVRGPSVVDLIEEILAMGVPAGLLALFAFTYFRNKRRERQGGGEGSSRDQQLEGRAGRAPKGPP